MTRAEAFERFSLTTRPEQLCECDCCGAMVPRDRIAMVIAYGIETGACDVCRGVEPEDAPSPACPPR